MVVYNARSGYIGILFDAVCWLINSVDLKACGNADFHCSKA